MKFQEKLEPYFRFTQAEKRGAAVLLLLILLVTLLRIFLPNKLANNESNISMEIAKSRLKNIQSESNEINNNKTTVHNKINKKNIIIDPNTCSVKDLISVGISEFASRNIIKFRDEGGYFVTLNDMYKIYGIDSTIINVISKQIQIDTTNLLNIKIQRKAISNSLKIELNSADTIVLRKIPGIGKVLSKRIVGYRKLLGGFSCTKQLEEIYGVNKNDLNKIISHIKIDTNCIVKINLNSASERTLKKHPYISTFQAKAIIKLRQYMGQLKSPNEVLNNHIFTLEEYSRIKPYLTVKKS